MQGIFGDSGQLGLPGLSRALLAQALPLAEVSGRLQAAARTASAQEVADLAQETAQMAAHLARVTRQMQDLLKGGAGLNQGP